MKALFKNFDWGIFLAGIFLAAFSLTILFSISPNLFPQQLFYFLGGLFFFFIFSQIDYRVYQHLAWPIYFFGILLLFSTFLQGELTRGATRWIEIAGFYLQPSEVFKPFFILFLSSVINNKNSKGLKQLFFIFILFIFPVILIFKQPDFGNVLIYCSIFLGLLFSRITNIKYLFLLTLSFILGLPVVWNFLKPYQKQRLITFIDPTQDPLGRGYNILQSIIAVGSGEFFGRGLGRGTQSHLKFLPEFHTDFIFASLAEELGFWGAFLILLVNGFLLLRILKISKDCADELSKLASLGVFVMIFGQVFINVGMNIGILPITGITLPLISYGGSSILAIMISLGIVENIAKNRENGKSFEIR